MNTISGLCKEEGSIFRHFSVLLTMPLVTIFVNNQPDAHLLFLYLFIPILYMFRATKCSSSGESI